MAKFSYSEHDYAFGRTMLTLRTAIGLTQSGLSECLDVSRRSVGEWEAGNSYPNATHLKQFIALGVKQQAFPAGHEAEEIRTLWNAAHQKVLFDEQWLCALLGPQQSSFLRGTPTSVEKISASKETSVQPVAGPRVHWGEALAVPTFYGRKEELELLTQWVVQERCRVVSVLGVGGIGKSALAVSLMHQVAEQFEVVFCRSLRDTPSCDTLLEECLQILSPQGLGVVPASFEQRLNLLFEHLSKVRALVVLDNLETLLEEGNTKGRFRPGFEDYGVLLRRLVEREQQSCLLLTSREKPVELRASEGKHAPVRSLRLSGLDNAACEQLLAEKDVVGTLHDQVCLAEAYARNPLALKMVAETIADLFGGEISQFLAEGIVIFGSIADLLAEQFARLSALEKTVLCWLALLREPVTIEELLGVLVVPLSRAQLLEAIDCLRRRSLIERGQRSASFTLQGVVLEYVTAVLIEEVTKEIRQQRLHRLIEHDLEQAKAKEYVRQTQQRLIVAPILVQLRNIYLRNSEVEEHLLSLLNQLRERAESAQGYGPANLIALLREHRGHLDDLNLSRLAIRSAYLQGVEMRDTSLAGASFRDTVFTESFSIARTVAISRDGQYWAAGSTRGEVRVWSQGDQVLQLVWQAHTDSVYTIAFSPDGRTLATGSWDGTVKLWDREDGTLLWTGWHASGVNCVAFAPDGCMLASAGDDAIIQFWDVSSGLNVQTLVRQGGALHTVAWSPDGRLLASGGLDGIIRLWQIQETQPATCIKLLLGHTSQVKVKALAFAPDGTSLVSASWDGTVRLWDLASGRERQTLMEYAERPATVAWSPDGHTIAWAGFDQTIWLWDIERGKYRAALCGHTATVYSIAFTPDSGSLLSSSEDNTLRVWNVESGQCVHIIKGYEVSLYGMSWSPDGTWLAAGGSDMLVTVWNVTHGTRSRVLHGHRWTVQGVAWSPDGRFLASSGRDNSIRLWDPATGACLQSLRDLDHVDTIFYGLGWSPDGNLLASGGYMCGVQVWDVVTRTRRWVGHSLPTRIRCVTWSPDGTQLASGGDDGSVCLWEAATGALLKRLQGHHGVVMSVAWSPGGYRLASGGGSKDGGELLVWDAHSGKILCAIPNHTGSVFTVAWGKQEDQLVSGESDGKLRWWDIGRRVCLRTLAGHNGAVQLLRSSPDGRLLASIGSDSTIQVWDLESAELLQTLRYGRPYERLNIIGAKGLTVAQKATLCALGAIEESEN